MSIDVKLISQLREKTGAGLSDCKTALEEARGNLDQAVEIMRKKGEIKAAKKADRAVKEGVIAVSGDSKKTAIVGLACETDFVSRTEDFRNTVQSFADKLLVSQPEEFKIWAENQLKELVMKVGENMQLSGFGIYEGEVVGRYIHANLKVAGICVLTGGNETLANDIAMQIVAMSPRWLEPSAVDAAVIEKEKEIYREQLKSENKPEQIWDKIIEGKLNKFYEENCLLNQIFIKDDSKKIKDLLGEAKISNWAKYILEGTSSC
ncbi:MAG: translation elongation factor Ts [Patescibacteria group bacterium]|jgi:elongation factor Ts